MPTLPQKSQSDLGRGDAPLVGPGIARLPVLPGPPPLPPSHGPPEAPAQPACPRGSSGASCAGTWQHRAGQQARESRWTCPEFAVRGVKDGATVSKRSRLEAPFKMFPQKLNREVQDFYADSYKTLLKEISDALNKWKRFSESSKKNV